MKLKIIILTILIKCSLIAFAQTDSVLIKTSAVCGTCKKTLEHDLSFERGIKKVSLDVDTKILTVFYNPEKTSEEKIRTAVVKSGYDADSAKADPKAFRRLPDCCKEEKHLHNE